MNITNVPSGGVNLAGPNGEYLKIILTNKGTSTNPNWYLAQWNSSRVFGGSSGFGGGGWYSGTTPLNAGAASAYDWNVSVNLKPGAWSIGAAGQGSFPFVDLGNMAVLVQGSFGGHVGDYGATVTSDPANITAVSLSSMIKSRLSIGATALLTENMFGVHRRFRVVTTLRITTTLTLKQEWSHTARST
jgi:hypothetical protein